MTRRRTSTIAAVATALLLAVAGCSSSSSPADAPSGGVETPTAPKPVKIGVVGAAQEQWTVFKAKAKAAGIEVDIVDFSDYAQPNPAVTQGELDLNQFQHLKYLSEYNVSANADLVPIGATAVYPLALYSKKYKAVADIPAGAEIAVPNDPSNLARALLVLQDAGLITLKDGGSAYSTEKDVLPESKVKVTAVEAAQTAVALGSVAASIINNDFVTDAGLKPDEALYQDDAASDAARPYINIWVARAADKANPTYLKLVEISHDPEVEAAVKAASGGTAVIATQTGAELEGYLADLQKQTEASQG